MHNYFVKLLTVKASKQISVKSDKRLLHASRSLWRNVSNGRPNKYSAWLWLAARSTHISCKLKLQQNEQVRTRFVFKFRRWRARGEQFLKCWMTFSFAENIVVFINWCLMWCMRDPQRNDFYIYCGRPCSVVSHRMLGIYSFSPSVAALYLPSRLV